MVCDSLFSHLLICLPLSDLGDFLQNEINTRDEVEMPTLSQAELDHLLGEDYARLSSSRLLAPTLAPARQPSASKPDVSQSGTQPAASLLATNRPQKNHNSPNAVFPNSAQSILSRVHTSLSTQVGTISCPPASPFSASTKTISVQTHDPVAIDDKTPESDATLRLAAQGLTNLESVPIPAKPLDSDGSHRARQHQPFEPLPNIRSTPKSAQETILHTNTDYAPPVTPPRVTLARGESSGPDPLSGPVAATRVVESSQCSKPSDFVVPETPRNRLSHTSRVQAFNGLRELDSSNPVGLSNGLTSIQRRGRQEDERLIPESSTFAVIIPNRPRITTSPECVSLPYDAPVKNRWTDEQRCTLAFMKRTFANAPSQQVQIFNALFREELAQCGLKKGITRNAIEAQVGDMKAGAQGYDIWKIFNVNFTWWDRALGDLQERIQKTAAELGITLDIRVLEEEGIKKHGHRKRRAKNAIHRHGLSAYARNPLTRLAKSVQPLHHIVVNGPDAAVGSSPLSESTAEAVLTPSSNREATGIRPRSPRVPPRIVFRFFNFNSSGGLLTSHSYRSYSNYFQVSTVRSVSLPGHSTIL
jgi:hypothetical protein